MFLTFAGLSFDVNRLCTFWPASFLHFALWLTLEIF